MLYRMYIIDYCIMLFWYRYVFWLFYSNALLFSFLISFRLSTLPPSLDNISYSNRKRDFLR